MAGLYNGYFGEVFGLDPMGLHEIKKKGLAPEGKKKDKNITVIIITDCIPRLTGGPSGTSVHNSGQGSEYTQTRKQSRQNKSQTWLQSGPQTQKHFPASETFLVYSILQYT